MSETFHALGRTVVRHLTQDDLAERWRVSPRTLERWRMEGKGPEWLRLPGRVVYREEDVAAFEAAHLRPN